MHTCRTPTLIITSLQVAVITTLPAIRLSISPRPMGRTSRFFSEEIRRHASKTSEVVEIQFLIFWWVELPLDKYLKSISFANHQSLVQKYESLLLYLSATFQTSSAVILSNLNGWTLGAHLWFSINSLRMFYFQFQDSFFIQRKNSMLHVILK